MYGIAWNGVIADLVRKVIATGEQALRSGDKSKVHWQGQWPDNQFNDLLEESGRGDSLTRVFQSASELARQSRRRFFAEEECAGQDLVQFDRTFAELEAGLAEATALRDDLFAAFLHVFRPNVQSPDREKSLSIRLEKMLTFLRSLVEDESFRRERDQLLEAASRLGVCALGKPNEELAHMTNSAG